MEQKTGNVLLALALVAVPVGFVVWAAVREREEEEQRAGGELAEWTITIE